MRNFRPFQTHKGQNQNQPNDNDNRERTPPSVAVDDTTTTSGIVSTVESASPSSSPPAAAISNPPAEINVSSGTKENVLALTLQPQYDLVGMDHEMATQFICANFKAFSAPEGDDDDGDDDRAPIDVMIALDVSGSMGGNPLKLCKLTLELLLKILGPEDRFGLVAFDSSAVLECKLAKLNPKHKERCLNRIRNLEARAMTNISQAIDVSCQELRRIGNPNEIQTVLLLTDGQPNEGVHKHNELVKFTEACLKGRDLPAGNPPAVLSPSGAAPKRGFFLMNKKRHNNNNNNNNNNNMGHGGGRGWGQRGRQGKGIFGTSTTASASSIEMLEEEFDEKVNLESKPKPKKNKKGNIGLICFGYGDGHNGSLLREMAETVHGSYYFVKDQADVGSAFGDAIGGLLSIVAKSVRVQIQLPTEAKEAGVSIVRVHHNKDSMEHNAESGSYFVSLGDFYAEESRDILVEVQMAKKTLATTTEAGSNNEKNDAARIPHLVVSGNYFNTLTKHEASIHPVFCYVERPPNSNGLSPTPNAHVQAQWLRIHSLKTMEEVRDLASSGNDHSSLSDARSKLDALLRELDAGITGNDGTDAIIEQLKHDVMELHKQLRDVRTYNTSGAKYLNTRLQTHGMQRCMESSAKTSNVYRNKKKASVSQSMSLY